MTYEDSEFETPHFDNEELDVLEDDTMVSDDASALYASMDEEDDSVDYDSDEDEEF